MELLKPTSDTDIKPISSDTVHRICSGQVVLSLATAVKELVENAIDAKATKIDIRLREYGSELVEVADNGSGVKKENFQALTLKHHTSKIRDFTDLECVETLGFRGEALSSLCALSDLSIVTKHATAQIGSKIVYDHNGLIVSEAPAARLEGTQVSLANLFSTLPVRRKEFMKNLKRDFSKMCHLLYAYCLVSKGVRFYCTNQLNKGTLNTVVQTEGTDTIRENIVSVFGAKQISSLIDVEMVRADETILKEYGLTLVPGEQMPFSLEFCVSSVTHGHGRSSTDRQFYYINSRPCEPTKIMKLVNETYRHYNSHQYPFVFLNITMEKSQIDVNVTPDKRQIFLAKEKLLLATVKASLIEAFKMFPSTYKINNVDAVKISDIFGSKSEKSSNIKPLSKGIKRCQTEPTTSGTKVGSILEMYGKKAKTESSVHDRYADLTNSQSHFEEESVERVDTNTTLKTLLKVAYSLDKDKTENIVKVVEQNMQEDETEQSAKSNAKEELPKNVSESQEIIFALDKKLQVTDKKTVEYDVSIHDVQKALKNIKLTSQPEELVVKFRSKITPEANASAERELQKQITKSMFKEMDIIGQFNHGFIITKLNHDLFIIDQHATDEKYNFEQLQFTTVLDSQILVNPKPLELTAANESILIDNEDIFKKNGFTFKIDSEAQCTKKVFLTAVPMSKNYIFGKDDIDEMLFMLKDSNYTMCRPSRVRTMFASRACRKSVMIGKPLTHSDMRLLVDHMGEIEQPWNCPHGRPTMRHLLNLNRIHQGY